MSIASGRAGELLKAAVNHADYVLERAADRTGKTPLFVNALDADNGEPACHDYDHVDRTAMLSSPASQQNWLRTLAALSALTGQSAYREAAEDVFRYMLKEQTDRNGLIYWGGHTSYDLEERRVAFASDKARVHELKCHYPDYNLMWNADRSGTKRYIEAVWNAHIIDWSNLDFNRHGPYDAPPGALWANGYEDGDVFFWGGGLTFVNAGSDLYYGAAMLAKLTGEDAPLEWAMRLAERYAQTRRSGVGISGYQFSQSASAWCDGPAIRGDRAQYQLAPLIPEGRPVYESTLFKPRPAVQRCQLAIGEALGDRGRPFLDWSCGEMAAWGRTAYRGEDNSFVPMLTDGWSLEGLTLDRNGYFGRKGTVFKAIPAGPEFFWMYAMGYRLSGDPFLWTMVRNIAAGLGFGDIGEPDGGRRGAKLPGPATGDHRILFGMLELHKATGRDCFLSMANQTANQLLGARYRKGRFVTGGKVLINDPAPLALLHLVSAETNAGDGLPSVFQT
ncbi:pectate lyase [Paenibacillus arenilitoris]|uniref:Pectate lyase n=1 Tax=Paenibacillus arenilitoris TaxID=2772299 RepID=A0A927H539_9BACL|nr:pectate lyase [Paenibacillus arenilitoris]MBD2868535.1 pectate lyase [Paenibacillus arenilitoris]